MELKGEASVDLHLPEFMARPEVLNGAVEQSAGKMGLGPSWRARRSRVGGSDLVV